MNQDTDWTGLCDDQPLPAEASTEIGAEPDYPPFISKRLGEFFENNCYALVASFVLLLVLWVFSAGYMVPYLETLA